MHSFGYIIPSSPFPPTLTKKANLPLPGNELSGSEEVRFHSDFVCFWKQALPGDKESDFGVLNSQNLLRITELEGVSQASLFERQCKLGWC